jgi:C-terminal processing protease CtpA/Prc
MVVLVLASLVDGGPAQLSGLVKAGDELLAVDKKKLHSVPQTEVAFCVLFASGPQTLSSSDTAGRGSAGWR